MAMAALGGLASARRPNPSFGSVEKRRVWRGPQMLAIGTPGRYPVPVSLSESGLNFVLPAV
jgi:hypothetical protein